MFIASSPARTSSFCKISLVIRKLHTYDAFYDTDLYCTFIQVIMLLVLKQIIKLQKYWKIVMQQKILIFFYFMSLFNVEVIIMLRSDSVACYVTLHIQISRCLFIKSFIILNKTALHY